MCRILAYQGSRRPISELIYSGERSFVSLSKHAYLSVTPVNADGFGVGWYDRFGKPGHYRDVLPAWGDENLLNISEHIASTTMFAHIRASTETETSRVNCHPFKHQQWLFMHNGQMPQFSRIRRAVEHLIRDEDYVQRIGTTDSEAIFLAFFAFELDADPLGAVSRTLHRLETFREQYQIHEPLRFTSALTNGEALYAIRYSSDDQPPSLYYGQCDANEPCDNNGSVLIASEPTSTACVAWNEVPANCALSVIGGKATLSEFVAKG